MLPYLLKSAACLAILLLFYKIFLERENMHVFKRFYLLASLVACFAFPLVTFTQYVEVEPIATPIIQNTEFDTLVFDHEPLKEEPLDFTMILWATYFLGVLVFTVKFVRNLYKISKRVKNGQKLREKIATKVLHQEDLAPHTFLRYIFLNRNQFEAQKIPKEVLLHEEAHVIQKHSFDILFVELLQIALWFNPLFYWIKHLIKTNHEFLADKSVTQQTKSTQNYQHLLLTLSSSNQEPSLANSIRYSSIEKRLLAMKRSTSKSKTIILTALILPLLALLIYSFSTTDVVQVQADSPKVESNIPVEQKINAGVSEALMQEYRELVKVTKTSTGGIIIKAKDYERATAIYALMSDAQRVSVEKYPQPPTINLVKTKKKSPTKAQFESWKNEKEFAIWINNKHVSNSELNKYTADDIVHYMGSFVYKNARSERFPQEYQFHLYTSKGFEESFQKANLKEYNRLAKNYTDKLNTYLKTKSEKDYDELLIAYTLAEKAYVKLSQNEIEKYGAKPTHSLPNRNIVESIQKEKNIAIHINKKGQLLVIDEPCSIDHLKNRLSEIIKSYGEVQKSNITVSIKVEKETPPSTVTKVKEVLRGLGMLKIDYEGPMLLPPPPPKMPSKPEIIEIAVNDSQHIQTYFDTKSVLLKLLGDKKGSYPSSFNTLNEKQKSTFLKLYKLMVFAYDKIESKDKKELELLPPPPKWTIYQIRKSKVPTETVIEVPTSTNTSKPPKLTDYYGMVIYLDNDDMVLIPNGWTRINRLRDKMEVLHSSKRVDSTTIHLLIQEKASKKTIATTKKILNEFGMLKTKLVEKVGWISNYKKPEIIEVVEEKSEIIEVPVEQKRKSAYLLGEYNSLIVKIRSRVKKNREIKTEDIERAKYLLGQLKSVPENQKIGFPNIPEHLIKEKPQIIEVIEEVPVLNTEKSVSQAIEVREVPPPPAVKKSNKIGPQVDDAITEIQKYPLQSKIDFLKNAEKLGAMFTQIDTSHKYPHYNSNITLGEAIKLVKNDVKMQLYPKKDKYGTFIFLSNNIENKIPKLTKNNRIEHFRSLDVIGAKYYLNNSEITLKEAIKYVRRNPTAIVNSTINPPIVKIEK